MNQQVTNLHALGYVAAIVAGAMLSALGVQLSQGAAPVPTAWAWLVPVLVAGVTAATMLLPRVTSAGRVEAPSPAATVSIPAVFAPAALAVTPPAAPQSPKVPAPAPSPAVSAATTPAPSPSTPDPSGAEAPAAPAAEPVKGP